MPRSKRARVVHESKTVKKDHKEQTRRLYANIRECVEEYDRLFVFSVDNMRNTYLKDVRAEFGDSRYDLEEINAPKSTKSCASRRRQISVSDRLDFHTQPLIFCLQSLLRQDQGDGRCSWYGSRK